MNAGTRIAAFGLGLVVAFGAAFAVGRVTVPDSTRDQWAERAEASGHHTLDASAGIEPPTPAGLSLSQDGVRLADLDAPAAVATPGAMTFRLLGPDGPVTRYETVHDQDMHLVVIRSDGAEYRHAHPTTTGDGQWTVPWTWEAAGTYRVFVDFTPTGHDALTLTSTVSVPGSFAPIDRTADGPDVTTARIDDLEVRVSGDLTTAPGELTFSVTRDGEPVTTLEPYLGAAGHLVALRAGDLAYLHVHPTGEGSGPDISFAAQAPTAGRYLLHLDFRVDGVVRSVAFALTARDGGAASSAHTTDSERSEHRHAPDDQGR